MIYLRARFYAPELNRFLQKDILRGSAFVPQSLNRYLYVQNDPINFADSSGRGLKDVWNAVKGVVGGVVTGVVTGAAIGGAVGGVAGAVIGGVVGGITGGIVASKVKPAQPVNTNPPTTKPTSTSSSSKSTSSTSSNSSANTSSTRTGASSSPSQMISNGLGGNGNPQPSGAGNYQGYTIDPDAPRIADAEHLERCEKGKGIIDETLTLTQQTIEKLAKNGINKIVLLGTDAAEWLKTSAETLKNKAVETVDKVKNSPITKYIDQSAEAFLLGDYSDRDQTWLSIGGGVIAGFANVDLPLDARDLMYDATHVNELDYPVVRIGLDLIAFIPVLGVLKYTDEVVDIIKAGKRASDLVDAAADVAKHADDIADIAKHADDVTDIAKHADDISDAAKAGKKAGDITEATGDVGKHADDVADAAKQADNAADAAKAIKKVDIDDLPENVQESFEKYDKAGWKGNVSGQTPGTGAGGGWDNDDGQLPSVDENGNPIKYREFDVNNKVGPKRDGERFVVGSDGSVYYTDSHYGQGTSINGIDDFVKIK